MMGAALLRDRRGATAVECALVMPVLLTLLLGMLEFGRALWIRQDLQFAVEEASRYGLANDTASSTLIAARAQSRLLGAGAVQVQVEATPSLVTVTATTSFAPLVSGLLPDGLVELTARSSLAR